MGIAHQRTQLLVEHTKRFSLLRIAGVLCGIGQVNLFQRQRWQQVGQRDSRVHSARQFCPSMLVG